MQKVEVVAKFKVPSWYLVRAAQENHKRLLRIAHLWSFCKRASDIAVKWLALLLPIMKVLGSNIGPETGYSY
jgi:hypothetical protein